MLRTLDAWLLWYVASVVIGGGTTLTTNFGQILSASGAEGSLTPTCVSLFGACNFLGRLTCMAPSNALVSRGLPRAYFAAIIAVSMLGAHLGFLGPASTATATAATALASGAHVAVQSTHKTLGSLTQSAMVHASGGAVARWPRLAPALATATGTHGKSFRGGGDGGGAGAGTAPQRTNAIAAASTHRRRP